MGYYIGVDGGGTFTDCRPWMKRVRLYFAKAATTKEDFAVGMFDALAALAEECGTSVSDLIASTERFNLGTTVGTNLLVERRGSRTGLLATAGHGDAILIMRGTGRTAGAELDLLFHPQATQKPVPLVPRALIREKTSVSIAWVTKWSRWMRRQLKQRCVAWWRMPERLPSRLRFSGLSRTRITSCAPRRLYAG